MTTDEIVQLWTRWNNNPSRMNEIEFMQAAQAMLDNNQALPPDVQRSYNLLVMPQPLAPAVITEVGGWLPWVGGALILLRERNGAMNKNTLYLLAAAGLAWYIWQKKQTAIAPPAPATPNYEGMV